MSRVGDLLAGNVGMEQDTGAGMGTLAGEAQRALFIAGKAHAAAHQIAHDGIGGADHQAYGVRVILVMARTHGIVEKRTVVRFAVLHTDAALRQKRVALVGLLLGQQQDAVSLGEIECTVQPRCTRADDHYVKIFVKFHFFTPFSWINRYFFLRFSWYNPDSIPLFRIDIKTAVNLMPRTAVKTGWGVTL